jgi:FtsH-binding integral membrane protein
MDALLGSRPFDFKSLSDFSHLEKRVQEHLKKVYASLAICMITATAGAYVRLFYAFFQNDFGFLITLGLMFGLYMTPHTPANIGKRMAMLLGFAFTTGLNLGRLIGMVASINPEIIPTALLGTGVVFVCFTLAALYTHKRSYLYLGGILATGLTTMLALSLANLFMGSSLLYSVELYLGLAVMCGMVLYDTQLIVEKSRRGDDDFIWHCIDLFLDIVAIFRRLLVILSQKEQNKNRKRN